MDNNVGAARDHAGDNTERMGSSHRASVTLGRYLRWTILICAAQTERAIRMKYRSGRCSFSVDSSSNPYFRSEQELLPSPMSVFSVVSTATDALSPANRSYKTCALYSGRYEEHTEKSGETQAIDT